MKSKQLDLNNANAFGVFALLYEKIWGKELGRRYLEMFFAATIDEGNADSEEWIEGIELGVSDFLYSSRSGLQPMRWFSCFRDEDEKAGG
jgi:hypothetical protein